MTSVIKDEVDATKNLIVAVNENHMINGLLFYDAYWFKKESTYSLKVFIGYNINATSFFAPYFNINHEDEKFKHN